MQSTLYIRIPIPFMSCISVWLPELARRIIGRMHNKYTGVEMTELSVLANSRERIFILSLSLFHLPASLYSFYLSSQPSLISSYLHLPLLQGHVCFHTHTHTISPSKQQTWSTSLKRLDRCLANISSIGAQRMKCDRRPNVLEVELLLLALALMLVDRCIVTEAARRWF